MTAAPHSACASLSALALIATVLTGCASFSPDAGMGAVSGIVASELKKDAIKIDNQEAVTEARERTRRLLKSTLSAQTAVQVALLNNKGLQAAYDELGISEAQFIAATLPPSPTLSVLHLSGPSFLEIEHSVSANLLALLTLRARADIAEGWFRQAQLRAAEATLRLAAQTRRAYYRTVADSSTVGFLEQARSAAETTSELAKRLGETGALSKLDQAREHAFYGDLSAQLAQARLRQRGSRERLTRLLGLWGSNIEYRLPASLPLLPRHPRSLHAVEVAAIARRIDLRIACLELETLAKQLGLTEATRFVTMLDLAGVHRYERTETETIRGGGVLAEIQIPIFDLGETRVREAQQTYMQAVNRLAEKAVNIRSEAREAYQLYRGSYGIAQHYQTKVLPLRKVISDETLLRYNGMLVDLFQLLADARARIDSNVAAIQAQRDFFVAASDLSVAITGGGRVRDDIGADSSRTSAKTAADSEH
jgi:outer membrane protein TolC